MVRMVDGPKETSWKWPSAGIRRAANMTKIVKAPVVEWQLGRLELGRVSHELWDGGWSLLDRADLHWFGFNQESYPVKSFAGVSNAILDGRQAIAQVIRPSKKRLL